MDGIEILEYFTQLQCLVLFYVSMNEEDTTIVIIDLYVGKCILTMLILSEISLYRLILVELK